MGRNGAGKSTFSKLVCGFEDPDSGEISFHGKDLLKENIRHRAKYIGYVMQNPNQMISKTMIYDEVALSLQKSGMAEAEVTRSRRYAQNLRALSIPKLAGIGIEFRSEKACDDRKCTCAGSGTDHPG